MADAPRLERRRRHLARRPFLVGAVALVLTAGGVRLSVMLESKRPAMRPTAPLDPVAGGTASIIARLDAPGAWMARLRVRRPPAALGRDLEPLRVDWRLTHRGTASSGTAVLPEPGAGAASLGTVLTDVAGGIGDEVALRVSVAEPGSFAGGPPAELALSRSTLERDAERRRRARAANLIGLGALGGAIVLAAFGLRPRRSG